MNVVGLFCNSFIGLYRLRRIVMSEAQTTKTVVVANDIHKAIRVYAEERDRAIQEVVDEMLRAPEGSEMHSDVMETYNRLEKANNLPSV